MQRRFIDAVAIVLRVAVAGQGGGIGMPVTVAVKRVTPQAGRWCAGPSQVELRLREGHERRCYRDGRHGPRR